MASRTVCQAGHRREEREESEERSRGRSKSSTSERAKPFDVYDRGAKSRGRE